MGVRKTIYVSDEVVWEQIKDAAEKLGVSVSQYLLGRDKVVDAPSLVEMRLKRIEVKLDELISSKGQMVVGPIARDLSNTDIGLDGKPEVSAAESSDWRLHRKPISKTEQVSKRGSRG